jgi:hypothetical protein
LFSSFSLESEKGQILNLGNSGMPLAGNLNSRNLQKMDVSLSFTQLKFCVLE